MKKTLAVFAGLIVLAGLLGWLALGHKARPNATTGEYQPTDVFRPASPMRRITIENSGGKIVLEFSDEARAWFMTDPQKSLVDATFLSPLYGGIHDMKKQRIILIAPTKDELKERLLDPPDVVLTVDYADGSPPTVLHVGKETYTRDGFFARLEGEDTVFAIPDSLRLYLHADAKTFRSPSLMLHGENSVGGIEFHIVDPAFGDDFPGAYSYKIVRQDNKRMPGWIFTEPFQETANPNAVFYLLRNLSLGVVPDVIDPDNGDYSPYGLDHPRAIFTITGLDGAAERILVGAFDRDKGLTYIRNENRSEIMPLDYKAMARSLLSNIRRDKIVDVEKGFDPDRIKAEYPREGTPTIVLVKKEGQYLFTVEGKPDVEVNYDRALQLGLFLKDQQIGYLKNVPPFDLAQYGLEKPRITLQVSERDNLFLDVAIGDTVREQGKLHTIVLDRKRDCIVYIQADFYEETPWKPEFLTGNQAEQP